MNYLFPTSKPDYELIRPFLREMGRIGADLVICCGDFTEAFYEGENDYGELYRELKRKTDIFLAGNHDPVGQQEYYGDNVKFIHGHKLAKGSEGYIEACHLNAEQDPLYIVLGHTHVPRMGRSFMDIGSLTLTGTYGVLDEGRATLISVRS